MISNEYAVKLCLEHEVKRGNKVVKKELIVALRDDVPLLGGEELSPFVCKIGKSNRNKKRSMENLNLFYQDIGTSSSAGGHLTQEEAAKEALLNQNYQKLHKVELDGKIVKEEEEAVKRIKGEALKEKDDLGAFIFPIRLEGKVNKNALAMILARKLYAILTNVLCRVAVTTLIAKFLILDIPINRDAPIVVGKGFLRTINGIVNTLERLFLTFDGFCHQTFRAARSDVMRNAESDSDDEEEYQIKKNKFGSPIYGPKLAPYLNYNDPAERSLAIQTVTNPFRKISVWKKAISFLGSLPVPLKHTMGTHDDEAGSSRSKRSRQHETVKEACSPCVVNWDVLNKMGCDGEIDDMLRIRLREAESNEDIFTSVAWIRAFNINEPTYA
ncbi:hypothetical protein Tco_0578002 [Tanacetum coccineum]